MSGLHFKRLSQEDTEKIFNESKGNVADYFYKFKSVEAAREWVIEAIKQQNENKKIEYVVYEKNRLVGMISYRFIDPVSVDIGMWVAVSSQGKGFGKRILEEIITILKDNGVREVVYETDADNLPSSKLAESLGFSLVKNSEVKVYKLYLY